MDPSTPGAATAIGICRGIDLHTITLGNHRELPLLDVVEPVTLRNNRWRCDHRWDVDLDDGSTNYRDL